MLKEPKEPRASRSGLERLTPRFEPQTIEDRSSMKGERQTPCAIRRGYCGYSGYCRTGVGYCASRSVGTKRLVASKKEPNGR
jgi:hypothetical protein